MIRFQHLKKIQTVVSAWSNIEPGIPIFLFLELAILFLMLAGYGGRAFAMQNQAPLN
jgi:hypothetical protein